MKRQTYRHTPHLGASVFVAVGSTETILQWEKIIFKSFSSEHEHECQCRFHLIMAAAPPSGSTLTKPWTKDTAVSPWYSLHLELSLCKRLIFFVSLYPRFLQEWVRREVLYFSTPLMGLLFPEPFPLLLVVWGTADSNNQIKDKFNPLCRKNNFIFAGSNHSCEY